MRMKDVQMQEDDLFKSIPGGYIRCGLSDGFPFLYISKRFLKILGWTAEEIREKFANRYENLVHPDDRGLVAEYVRKITDGRIGDSDEGIVYRLEGKSGYRWISDSTVMVTVSGKSFLQCILSDVSRYVLEKEDRERRLEASLKAAQERYEVIEALGTVYQEISVIDLAAQSYTILSGYGTTRDYQGYTGPMQEFQDFIVDTVAVPEQAEEVGNFVDFSTAAARLRDRQFLSHEFKGRNGIWYLSTLIVQKRDENGEATRLLLASRDINDQKERELAYQKTLEETAAEARRANEAKTNFLRRMSHDIRTPVNGIFGLIEMANRHRDDKELLWEYRKKTLSTLEYLLSLVNNILDMGKVESGKLVLEEVPFDLIELFDKYFPVVEAQAGEHDIKCITDAKVLHRKVIGSPVHINRILMNLANNAIKYNHPGGQIRMSCEETPVDPSHSVFTFRCSDTGCGMSEEFQKHIFEPFAQEGKDTVTPYAGSGLGLSIVKNITEQMGGTITFESAEGVGTTFTVVLPFTLGEEVPETETEEENLSLSGRRALLVEDNELNMEIARMFLEDEGLVITEARNGREAVELFESSEPFTYDFVFMDIMMPVMDGLEAARKIRSLERPDAEKVFIIAMSANAFQDDVQNSLLAGMNAHLTKPMEVKKLRQTLLRMMKTEQGSGI